MFTYDSSTFTCSCSDVLSFYKEELAGEKDNYIHSRARVMGQSPYVVLKDLADEVVAIAEQGRSILKGEKEREVWNVFVKGYAAFHYLSPRYQLSELLNGDAPVPC